jgi:hypothetical protein
MSNIFMAFALRDPPGVLLQKAKQHWAGLQSLFRGAAALVTTDTHPNWKSFLLEHQVGFTQAPPNWDHIGLHRRYALEQAITRSDAKHFLYTDIDHLLRWQERGSDELQRILSRIPDYDCLVIGRTRAGFAAAPERLQRTESLVNEIFRLISGCAWDTMMGTRGLSRKAALRIIEASKVKTLGNDVAWPLMLLRDGFNVGYVEANGLTYETNPVYADSALDTEDEDPAAWMLRVYAANQHVEAMRPFLDHPGEESIRTAETKQHSQDEDDP